MRYICIADNVYCADGEKFIESDDAHRMLNTERIDTVVSLDRRAGAWVDGNSRTVYVNRIVRHIENPYGKREYVRDYRYIRDTAQLILTLAQDGAVFFHCLHGKDRTGFVREAIEELLDPKRVPTGMREGDQMMLRVEDDDTGTSLERWRLDA
jgi:nucleoside-diphosphate-sugar epimerase